MAKKSSKLTVPKKQTLPSGETEYKLFLSPADVKTELKSKNVEVRSMAPMMKLNDFPIGQTLKGRVVKFFECGTFKGEKKGEPDKHGTGVEIKPDGAPVGVALPISATLRQGLGVTGEGATATSPYLGKVVYVEKLPEKLKSKRGQDAHHFVVVVDTES